MEHKGAASGGALGRESGVQQNVEVVTVTAGRNGVYKCNIRRRGMSL